MLSPTVLFLLLIASRRFRHRGTFISESLTLRVGYRNERMFSFPYMASVNKYSVNPFSRDLPDPDTRRNRLRLIMDVLKLHFVFLRLP